MSIYDALGSFTTKVKAGTEGQGSSVDFIAIGGMSRITMQLQYLDSGR